jgi:DNA-binding Lrp family transcriptional regulator
MQEGQKEDLTVAECKKRILVELEQNGPANGPELIERLGVSDETISRAVWDLIDSGRIALDWNSKLDLV